MNEDVPNSAQETYNKGYRQGKEHGYELAKLVLPKEYMLEGFVLGLVVGAIMVAVLYGM